MNESILIPINEDFIDVFETFMNEEQKTKIRANNVRQYIEGVIDLLLKNKIMLHLKPDERYEGISAKRKIEYIEKYSPSIAINIRKIFSIGGKGSHFEGRVSEDELNEIIEMATHFIEDIFVEYFLSPNHKFGTENIFTIFSMLPLKNRIYILENVYSKERNRNIVDRLSLAYSKNGDDEKFISLTKEALEEKIISHDEYDCFFKKHQAIKERLQEVQTLNSAYPSDSGRVIAKPSKSDSDLFVTGFPSSGDIFDTAKVAIVFKDWFEKDKDKYPEFIDLFYCLMARDDRKYSK
jgi:hypothetical protein